MKSTTSSTHQRFSSTPRNPVPCASMTFNAPHQFEELAGTKPTFAPILILGAGMSHSLVPGTKDLLLGLLNTQNDIEDGLGIERCTPFDVDDEKSLYRWAGEVVSKLKANGASEEKSKLKIAEILTVTTDPCWSAKAKMPLRGTSARHRVVARLSRESKWHSLWSLNWDVWLERALDSVGIESHLSRPAVPERLPASWIRWYETWVPPSKETRGDAQTIIVYKPHGCVESLLRGSGVFILTEDELEGQLANLPEIRTRVQGALREHSLVVVGWRASERYLVDLIAEVKSSRVDRATLTIIDPFPNTNGHKQLQEAYGLSAEQTMCTPLTSGFPSTDDAFLWLQARHGLSCLMADADDGEKKILTRCLADLAVPSNTSSAFVVDWFDNFLPVWSRLCFNSGRQKFFAGKEAKVTAIPTHRRDEHVPWGYGDVKRLDLKAATHLLSVLSQLGESSGRWRYDRFPGAIWDAENHHLIVPVPSWESQEAQSLQALKPLAESRHWENQGQIRAVSLLGIHHDASAHNIDTVAVQNWRYELSRLMHFSYFARPTNINWFTLDEWKASI